MKIVRSFITILSVSFFSGKSVGQETSITGAWHEQQEDHEAVIIYTGSYMMIAEFNKVNTAFLFAGGGSYTQKKTGQIILTLAFSSLKKDVPMIGTKGEMVYTLEGDQMTMTLNDSTKRTSTRIDKGNGELAGLWRLSATIKNGKTETVPDGAVKTLKAVSGTRFQWVTFNEETNEFTSSGGGHYTFKDGKYVEHIEFYRKDPDKIGTSVSYDVKKDKDTLTITSKGSDGEVIEEEWKRVGS